MSTNAKNSLDIYTQVVAITYPYLGPAADRFIARQVQNHLHKEPAELSRQDLQKLIDWVKLAISLITEDTAVVDEYIARLERLSSTDTAPQETQHAS